MKSLLPPPSRRALVLIDPPYEQKDDYQRVTDFLLAAHQRFASGTYMLWYPMLPRAEAKQLPNRLQALGDALQKSSRQTSWLQLQLILDQEQEDFGMYGSGIFILNPPYSLPQILNQLMPWLVKKLDTSGHGSFSLETAIL